MFQFPTFPFIHYFTHVWIIRLLPLIEFPHSDTHALTVICTYTWLFAACHVLLRLLMPRHSPYALSSLTFWLRLSFELLCQSSIKIFHRTNVLLQNFLFRFPCTSRLYCVIIYTLLLCASKSISVNFLKLLLVILVYLFIYIFFNVLFLLIK